MLNLPFGISASSQLSKPWKISFFVGHFPFSDYGFVSISFGWGTRERFFPLLTNYQEAGSEVNLCLFTWRVKSTLGVHN